MACRLFTSPITKQEVRSQLWDNIRDVVESDEQADNIYQKLTTKQFMEWNNNDWINNPIVDENTITDYNGEPKLIDNKFIFNNKGESRSIFDLSDLKTKENLKDSILNKLNDPISKQLFNKFYQQDSNKFYDKLNLDTDQTQALKSLDQGYISYNQFKDYINSQATITVPENLSNTLEEANQVYTPPVDYNYDDKVQKLNFSVSANVLSNIGDESTIAVRPNRYPSGIYKLNDEYYDIKQRPGKKLLSDYPDSKEIRKTLTRDDLTKDYIKDFADGKSTLFVYDITKHQGKVDPKDIKGDIKQSIISKQNIYKTGSPVFDKFIEKFYEKKKTLVDQLQGTKDPELQRKYSKDIASINRDIKNLATDATVSRLNATGIQQLKKLDYDINNTDRHMSLKEIYEGIRLTSAWRDIDDVLEFNKEYEDPEDAELIRQANNIRSKATSLYKQYYDRYLQSIKKDISETISPQAAEEALKPIKDIGNLEKSFIGISFSSNPLEQALDSIIRENNFNVSKEHEEFTKDLNDRLSGIEDKKLNFLLQDEKDGTKSFLTTYNRDFIKESSEKHGQAIREEITWEKYYDWFKDNFDYELTQEGEESFNDFAESIKDDYIIRDENGDPALDKQGELQYNLKAYNKELKNVSPHNFQKYLDGEIAKANRGSRWFNITPKDKHINPNYTKLSAQQKDIYSFYTDEFTKAQGNIPIDYRFGSFNVDQLLYNFTTSLDKSTLEQIKGVTNNVKNFLQDMATVNYTEPEYTNQNINPLTGELEDTIKFKNIESFKQEGNSPDLVKTLSDFKKFSLMYKAKSDAEDRINAIRDIGKLLEKAETTSDGRIKFNTFNDIIKTKGNTNVSDRLAYNAEAYLYDKRKDPLKSISSDPILGERSISLEKLIDTINNYTRIRQLALSPLSAISNLAVGGINNFMYSAQNTEFGDKELLKAYNILKGSIARFYSSIGGIIQATNFHEKNAEKAAKIIERFNLLGDLTESMYFDDKSSKLVNKLFFMGKGGEFLNQGATMVATLLKNKIQTSSGEKTMWDAISLDKNDNLVFDEAFDDKTQLDTFNKILKVNKRIHGDYDIDNPMYVKKSLLGRVFLLFRSWLPQAVYQRVHKETNDYQIGVTKGRWRSFEALYRDKDGKLDFKNAAKFLLKTAVPLVTHNVQFENVSELDANNLAVNVREMQFVAMLTMATLLLKGFIQSPDDDTRKKDPYLLYLYNQTNRFQNELTFFYSFTSFDQFIQDVIPIESTIRQMGKVTAAANDYIFSPEEDQYKSGFRKGNSKLATQARMLFPITKQSESLYSTFNNLYNDHIK